MFFRLAIIVTMSFTLLACAQTPVPYKVSKVLDYPSDLKPISFPLGVSQEKLKGNTYRITAKLAELSTHKRAKHMALYHASVLAEAQGFDAFKIEDKRGGNWCSNKFNSKSGMRADTSGGVSSRLVITLLDSTQAKKKLYLAAETKAKYKKLMEALPTEPELAQIQQERIEHCVTNFNKRKKHRNKRIRDKEFERKIKCGDDRSCRV